MITRENKGQSLIELIMILPLLIGFWVAMVWFAHVIILKIELLHTARHGVFWLAYQKNTDMDAGNEISFVTEECSNFIRRQDHTLDMSQLVIDVQSGDRWKPAKFGMAKAMFGSVLLGNDILSKLARRKLIEHLVGVDPHAKPASVTLTYTLETPPLLRSIPGFPATIPLRGYCVCYR
jgi:hypothetical protein